LAPASKKDKPVDQRSNLLEAIRGGIQLKSGKERKQPDNPNKNDSSFSVADILARRIAIAGGKGGDSDSDLSDDEEEWSD